jgi:hypothetical protein
MTSGPRFRWRSPLNLLGVALISLGAASIAAGLFFWLAALR